MSVRWVLGALLLSSLACTCGAEPTTTGPGFGGEHPAQPADPTDPREGRGKGPGGGNGRQRNPGDRPGGPGNGGGGGGGGGPGGGGGNGGGDRRPTDPPAGSPDRRAPEPAPEPGGKGITYVGDDTWQVERSRLNAWTNDPNKLGANVVKKGGAYEVTNVRSGSDADALGAEDGDLLQEVNGLSLSSDADLLQLWASVGSQDTFRVKLVRGGKSKTQKYDVVH